MPPGLYNVGTADLSGSEVELKQAGHGGGIFNGAGAGAVTLHATHVTGKPAGQLRALGTIAGCSG